MTRIEIAYRFQWDWGFYNPTADPLVPQIWVRVDFRAASEAEKSKGK